MKVDNNSTPNIKVNGALPQGQASARKNSEQKPRPESKPELTLRKYNFHPIKSADATYGEEVKNILDRFAVDADNMYNNAAISEDRNVLVLVVDGKTTLKRCFGGANAFSRFCYSIFGWIPKLFGSPDSKIASTFYGSSHTDLKSEEEKEDHMKHEDLSSLIQGLRIDHYHGICVFYKDKTGKFASNPAALAIVDSYKYLAREFLKEKGEEGVKRKELEDKFAKYYAIDKLIPLREKDLNFYDLYSQIAEGLYQAQGFDFLSLPGKVSSSGLKRNESPDLIFEEFPWIKVSQGSDDKWKLVGEDREANPIDMTFVRPKDLSKEPYDSMIADCDAWQAMYSGDKLRSDNPEDHKLVQVASERNAEILAKYNNAVFKSVA